jgi:ribosome biogenesis GTPase YqeH
VKLLKTKCDGCGVKIQTTSPNEKGYIRSDVYLKNPDHFLCERCFHLQHYNRVADISISEKEFLANAKKIAASHALVVHIIDVFDLEGTIIANINELFPNNKIMVVANKFDLFLSSTKPNKILNYLRTYLKEQGLHAINVSLISAKSKQDVLRLLNKIYQLKDEEEVYFFGVTNVGKSTIINQIIDLVESKASPITVSNLPGTTLGLIKLALPEKTFIIDTPGIIHDFQMTKYLDKTTLNLVIPQKYVKPRVYQLNPEQTLFVGGFAVFNFVSGEKSSFVAYFANQIVIHRTKLINAAEFYIKHVDDLLLIPTETERQRLGKMIKHEFIIDGRVDISIAGLGFMSIVGQGKVEVECFEPIKVKAREALIQ